MEVIPSNSEASSPVDIVERLKAVRAELLRQKQEGALQKTRETDELIKETADMVEGNVRLDDRTMSVRKFENGPKAQEAEG